MTQLALAWSVEHPDVTAALLGPRTNEQLDDLLTAADITLDADVLDAIDEVVAPGVDLNPADTGWTSAGARRVASPPPLTTDRDPGETSCSPGGLTVRPACVSARTSRND